jgi:hypothetical protein
MPHGTAAAASLAAGKLYHFLQAFPKIVMRATLWWCTPIDIIKKFLADCQSPYQDQS